MSLTLLQGVPLSRAADEMSRLTRAGIMSSAVRRMTEHAGRTLPEIHDFIIHTFPYLSDPVGTELFIAPNKVAEDYFAGRIRSGDCDDFAMLSAAMLGSISRNVRLVLMAVYGHEVDHAIAQVQTDVFGWLDFDTSSSLPLGWHLQGERYNVTV